MSSLLRNLQAHDTSRATTYTERGAYGRPALTMPLQIGPPDLQQWIGTRLDTNYRHEAVVQQLVRISTLKARPSLWQPAPVSPNFTTGELSSLLWWRERLIQGEEVEEDPNAALMIGLSLCLGIGGQDDEESLNASFDLLTRLWKRHSSDHVADTTLSMWCNHFLALYRPETELSRAWHKRHMRFSANPGGLEIWLRHVDQPITRGAWRHCTQPSAPLRAKMSPEAREVLDQMEKRALEITGRWMARTGRLDNLLSGPLGSDDTMIFGGTGYMGNIYYRQRMRAQLKLLPVTLKDAAKVPQSQMRRALRIGSSRPHITHADLMEELTSAGEQMLRDSGLIVEKTPKPRKKKAAPETETAAAPEPIQVDLARVQALEEDSARIRSRLLDTNDLAHLGVEADFSWSLDSEELPAPERDPEQRERNEAPNPETDSGQAASGHPTPQPDCASGGADLTPTTTATAADLTPTTTATAADSGHHTTLSAAARSLLRAARETPGFQPGRQWEGEPLDDLMDEINTLALNEIGDVLLIGDGSGLQLEASYEAFAQTLEDRQ